MFWFKSFCWCVHGSTSNSTALLQNLTVSQRPTLPCLLTQGQHLLGYQVKAGGINSVHTWVGYFGWKVGSAQGGLQYNPG
jgi:hypothetical protein